MNKEVEQQPTTAIDLFIAQELERFDQEVISEKDLRRLVKQYSDLKVNGIEDRQGLNEVRRARIDLKNKVVEIKKKGKATRDGAVKFQKAVIERENALVSIVEPTKKQLEDEEDRIADLIEQKRLEEERKESAKIQFRIDRLSEVNYAIDFHEMKALTEEQFEDILTQATVAHKEALQLKAEQEKREAEEKALKEKAQKEEELRLEKVRAEQAEKERIFQEEQAKFKAEQERVAREQAEREAKIKADQERIEAEKKAIQEAKEAEEREKKRLEELEAIKKKAAEDARIEAELKEKHRKEEDEERKKEAPDKEKFEIISKELETVLNNSIWNTFKSKKGKQNASVLHDSILESHRLAKSFADGTKTVCLKGNV